MEHQANTTPEAVIESVPNEPPVEPERKPLKPGKWYGIISLLCGLVPFLMTLHFMLFGRFDNGFEQSPLLNTINNVFLFTWILFFIAAPIFGVMGCKTQGRHYANIGFLLFAAYLPFIFGLSYLWHVILGYPK